MKKSILLFITVISILGWSAGALANTTAVSQFALVEKEQANEPVADMKVRVRAPLEEQASPAEGLIEKQLQPADLDVVSPVSVPAVQPDHTKRYSILEELKMEEGQTAVRAILWGDRKHERVDYFLDYFSIRMKDRFKIWLSRAFQYIPLFNKIFEEHGVSEELVFLPLIESGFSTHATSRAQAVGMWQFMKGTGKRYGLRVDRFVDERRDPEKSARAAAMYLKDLYEMFGSWDLALAAYNAGEGKISRAMTATRSKEFWDVIKWKKIKRETKEYVPRFVAASIIAKDPAEYGFTDIEFEKGPEFSITEVSLPPKTTLKSIARVIGVDDDVIQNLNPAIRNGFLPPDSEYAVKIPADKKELLLENVGQLSVADPKLVKKVLAKKEPRSKKAKSRKNLKKLANAKRKSNS